MSESKSVTMDQEIGETPFFPADPRAGAKVKKFVTSDGWYNGLIKSYFPETDTINVDLENGTEEQWTLDQYKAHSFEASIEVGDKGYKFVEVFENKLDRQHIPWNGTVISIHPSWRL